MNVVILTIARSGSSMVASIFAAHGFDTSRGVHASLRDGAKYWTYERRNLKAFYKQNRIRGEAENGKFFTYRNPDKFYRMVAKLPEPWVIKAGINMWQLFKPLGAVVVKVRRKEEALARSMATKKSQDYETTLADVREKAQLFDQVPGFGVCTDEIVAGDFSSLIPAFEAAGVEFDPDIARACVNPKDWHYT